MWLLRWGPAAGSASAANGGGAPPAPPTAAEPAVREPTLLASLGQRERPPLPDLFTAIAAAPGDDAAAAAAGVAWDDRPARVRLRYFATSLGRGGVYADAYGRSPAAQSARVFPATLLDVRAVVAAAAGSRGGGGVAGGGATPVLAAYADVVVNAASAALCFPVLDALFEALVPSLRVAPRSTGGTAAAAVLALVRGLAAAAPPPAGARRARPGGGRAGGGGAGGGGGGVGGGVAPASAGAAGGGRAVAVTASVMRAALGALAYLAARRGELGAPEWAALAADAWIPVVVHGSDGAPGFA